MLMYGSNFWSATFRPRATSSRPIEAAAMPLPSEETTPPVTKMNFVVWCRALGCIIQSSGLFRARETVPIRVRASKVFFRIDAAPRRITYDRDAHRHARGKWPQLLESLNLLQWVGRQRDPPGEGVAGVRVHTDVLTHARREDRSVSVVA